MNSDPSHRFTPFLRANGVISDTDTATYAPLTGGVSSDIWLVSAGASMFCIKAALPKLKVDADWFAPVERNTFEAAWMRVARSIVPTCTPEILAEDRASGMFAMTYLPPEKNPNWKSELRDGRADAGFARDVGRTVARIHLATAGDSDIAETFSSDDIFHAIRLEPYLEATAIAHPDVGAELMKLSRMTAARKNALVHGDVSPKNILVGPDGPVILDAECAWYGDPAFDLAFCLNHMLLKCIWVPSCTEGYLSCFNAMTSGYTEVAGDGGMPVLGRAAKLLPGLLLGRVDGRSPVEYLTSDEDKTMIRTVAKEALVIPSITLAEIRDLWRRHLKVDIAGGRTR